MRLRKLAWALTLVAVIGCGDAGDDSHPLPSTAGLVPADYVYPERCLGLDENGDWWPSLEQTGCVEMATGRPAAGALIYDVAVPLWSDHSAKERALLLPPDTKITFEHEGVWTLPDGAVVLKNFLLDGALIETRLMVRQGPRWRGVTYRWKGPETAELVTERTVVAIGSVEWTLPSEDDCDACHTRAAGYLLGITTEQMQVTSDMFGRGDVHQIAALADLELLDKPVIPQDLSAVFEPLDSPAPVAVRARSYLAANCSGCHRPGGAGHIRLDLRADIPLADSGACAPAEEDYGLGAGSPAVDPGSPHTSVLLHTLSTTGEGVMPPVGRGAVDEAAHTLLTRWVTELRGCQ